jgi:DNA-binding transcriptional LysR family regulator
VPANLTLKQLSYFVAVANEGHFRRAAERLHVSQPPLTQRIQALERDLGIQLFTRTGHRIELTEAGRLVLAEARAALTQVDRVREVARRVENGEAGRLRISIVCSVPFIPAFARATKAFQRDYPGVVLDLVHRRPVQGIEELRERRLDICLTRREPVLLPGIRQMTVARDQLMLVLPADHFAAAAEKVSLREVAQERFVVFPREQKMTLHALMMDLWARAELTPRIALEADNAVSMLSLVATGFGNAILPSLLSGIHMPNVVWKPLDMDEQWTSSSIIMLYRGEGPNAKIQSRYIEYIQRYSELIDQDGAAAGPVHVVRDAISFDALEADGGR